MLPQLYCRSAAIASCGHAQLLLRLRLRQIGSDLHHQAAIQLVAALSRRTR